MSLKILLDTNAYSHLKRGQPQVAELVRHCEHVVFSSIVAGELLYGFRSGARYVRNRSELETFLSRACVSFVPVSLVTAERFALIAANLKRKGTPLPTNDIWIAAHAMETGAELVSFDGHFEQIDGLAWTLLED